MAFASRKRHIVLCDGEVGNSLPSSKSEESLSDSECDSENELDDCAVLDVVMDGGSDQDDVIQDCMGRHGQLQGKITDQLSFRIQLVEGLFVKYAYVL
jgi:hypothetical protein